MQWLQRPEQTQRVLQFARQALKQEHVLSVETINMALLHISKRTRILLLFPPILLVSVVCLGSLFFVIFASFFSQPTEVLPFISKPDADGKLTLRGPTYQLRVWPTEVSSAWMYSNRKLPFVVALSVDRRKFGALEAPGEPSVVCKADGSCSDSCAGAAPCEDIKNGWYRVDVYPASQDFGKDRRALNLGPAAGTGILCGNSVQRGLQLCWDPLRGNAPFPVSEVRSVSYPAVRQASAYVWISSTNDEKGRPIFVADCTIAQCNSDIERDGAKLLVAFSPNELNNWERFDMELHDFAARLIEPLAGESDRVGR
jgi:hypothetical protein